jgi:Beta-xylosidase
MAGLVNFYNDKHYSWIYITRDEKRGPVIEIAQNDNNNYTSFLKDQAIQIPAGTEYVWFKTKVRKQSYTYEYSFDGNNWHEIPVELDAAILSDDYVLQTYGGFFTGAFVGLLPSTTLVTARLPNSTTSITRNWATISHRFYA